MSSDRTSQTSSSNYYHSFYRILRPVLIYYLLMLLSKRICSALNIPDETVSPLSSCLILPFMIAVFLNKTDSKRILIGAGVLTGCVLLAGIKMKNPIPISIIGVGLAGPISEESVFRGWVFSRSKESFGFRWALILSSLLFAAGHATLPQILVGFLAGCLLAYIREKTGSLRMPILLHTGWNLIQILLFP